MYSQNKKKPQKPRKAKLKGIQSTSMLNIPGKPKQGRLRKQDVVKEEERRRKKTRNEHLQKKKKNIKANKKLEIGGRVQSVNQGKGNVQKRRDVKNLSEETGKDVVKKSFVHRSKSRKKAYPVRNFNVNINLKNRLKIFEEKEPSLEDHYSIDGEFEKSPEKLPKIKESMNNYISPKDIMDSIPFQKLQVPNQKRKRNKKTEVRGGRNNKQKMRKEVRELKEYSKELANLAPENLGFDQLISSRKKKRRDPKKEYGNLPINKSLELSNIPIRNYLSNSKDIFSTLNPQNYKNPRLTQTFGITNLTGSQVIKPTQLKVFHKLHKIEFKKSIYSKGRSVSRNKSSNSVRKSHSKPRVKFQNDMKTGVKVGKRQRDWVEGENKIKRDTSKSKGVRFQKHREGKVNGSLSVRRNMQGRNDSKKPNYRSNTKDMGIKSSRRAFTSREKFNTNKFSKQKNNLKYKSEKVSNNYGRNKLKKNNLQKDKKRGSKAYAYVKNKKTIQNSNKRIQKKYKKLDNFDKDRFEEMKKDFEKKFITNSKNKKTTKNNKKLKNKNRDSKSKSIILIKCVK
jgi:hypothetical protein